MTAICHHRKVLSTRYVWLWVFIWVIVGISGYEKKGLLLPLWESQVSDEVLPLFNAFAPLCSLPEEDGSSASLPVTYTPHLSRRNPDGTLSGAESSFIQPRQSRMFLWLHEPEDWDLQAFTSHFGGVGLTNLPSLLATWPGGLLKLWLWKCCGPLLYPHLHQLCGTSQGLKILCMVQKLRFLWSSLSAFNAEVKNPTHAYFSTLLLFRLSSHCWETIWNSPLLI